MGGIADLINGSSGGGGGAAPVKQAASSGSKPTKSVADVAKSQSALSGLFNKTVASTKSSKPAQSSGKISSLINQEQNIAQGKKDDGWHWSLNPLKDVGQIAHHVPGVEGALTAIDTPAAYIRSGLNQAVNALDTSDKKGFDLGQLQSDAMDHKGFGDYFHEQMVNQAAHRADGKAHIFGLSVDPNGNGLVQRWGQRLLGLGGDISSDPLTYLTGGLSDAAGDIGHGVSTSNRVELAKRAATAAEQGAKGITDETVTRLARGGVTALTDAEKSTLGMKPTMGIKGLFGHDSVAIPGTSPIASGVRAATDKLRQVAGDTVVGRGARAIGTSAIELPLTNEAVSGSAHAAQAVKGLEAIDVAKATARQFGANRGKELSGILKGMSKDELTKVPQALEMGGPLTGNLGKLKTFMEDVRTEANAKGAGLGKIEDYYPHVLTPQAQEELAKQGITKASPLAGIKAPEILRKYAPGEDFMGTTLRTGSVDEINQIARDRLGHDVFDTSAKDILPSYIKQVQSAVNRGTYGQRLLEHGVARTVGDEGTKEISVGVHVDPWMANATEVAQKALGPEGYRQFMAGYDKFTKIWKAGATMTPGFHVRNAYAHAFNSYVAGVGNKAVRDEFSLYKAAKAGKPLAAEDAKALDFVQKVTHATGHEYAPEEIGMGINKKVLGAPGRTSRKVGSFVQDRLRGAMALDSYRAGDSLSSAIDRVERFHFNYSDISDFDKMAKRVIPFWMWGSRNLPLQLQMMAKNPGAYSKFNHFSRNISLGVPDDSVVPGYFGEKGAIRTDLPLPGGEGTKYLAPDLGFLRAQDMLDLTKDPVRILSQANPLIKLPVEMLANKKLYNDVPFRPGYQPLPAVLNVPGIKQTLEGLGLATEGAKGPMTTDKAMYALESLLPQEGKARRLAPSEKQYQERIGSTIASYFGLGSLTNTPAAQAGELDSRNFALQDFIKKQQALGFLPKKKQATAASHPYGKG